MLQRPLNVGFIAPCLPKLPSGDLWLHEIKHDGFRVIARKDGDRVRLYSRPGNDMTRRFPLIAGALARLRSRCSDHRHLLLRGDETLNLPLGEPDLFHRDHTRRPLRACRERPRRRAAEQRDETRGSRPSSDTVANKNGAARWLT
jgi:hypothetical protein